MTGNNVDYLSGSNNNEFVEIYEDEIKRLIKKNDTLRDALNKKENDLNEIKQEKSIVEKKLEQANNLYMPIEQLKKQNEFYKQKIESLKNEKDDVACIVDGLRKKVLQYEESEDLATKLEIEKKKVISLNEKLKLKDVQISTLILEQDKEDEQLGNEEEFIKLKESNETMKKELIEQKTQLAEILLEARMQSKELVDRAEQEAIKIKETANNELKKSKEEASRINNHLKKIKNESNTFISSLIEDVDNILS